MEGSFKPGQYGQSVVVERDLLVDGSVDIHEVLVSMAVRSFEEAVNNGARSLTDLTFVQTVCDIPNCDHSDKPHGIAGWKANFS